MLKATCPFSRFAPGKNSGSFPSPERVGSTQVLEEHTERRILDPQKQFRWLYSGFGPLFYILLGSR